MQKLINVLAVSSFVVSASIVGGGAYVYLNKDAMIEDVKEKVTNAATEALQEHFLECWMQQCLNFLVQLVVPSLWERIKVVLYLE